MAGTIYGKGWAFPIRPDATGALRMVEDEEAVQTSIFLILSTSPGERLMRPDFGCGIDDLVFQANTTALRGEVEIRVREALLRWEQRIDIVYVRAETSLAEPTKLLIYIDYRLRSNNAFFNLVYPLFLAEGAR